MIRVDTREAIQRIIALRLDAVDATDDALDAAARAAELSARRTTLFRDRTGKLRGTLLIRIGRGKDPKRVLWAPMKYASFINAGTRGPYTITPRRRSVLRFVASGRVVFARSVTHPGISKRPFLDNAAAQGGQALITRLRERMEDAIARANK